MPFPYTFPFRFVDTYPLNNEIDISPYEREITVKDGARIDSEE